MPSDTRTALIEAIASSLRKTNTQALDVSFNELLDMFEAGELNIRPDYQRLFRWTEGQRSRFIESLILEMPVPPIFVIEEEDNVYQLIDGLQRISSYLHLRGKLDAGHLDPPIRQGDSLVLVDCDIIAGLNGLTFADFPTALQIRVKRAFIRMEVIRKETDPKFKYHMFKRLNTGGEGLSQQEIRNCTIRMLDSRFPNFIVEMSESEAFKACTQALTAERRLSAFDQELVLRFFALKNRRDRFKHEVSDFLTEYMEDVADPERPVEFDYAIERICFQKTFHALEKSLSEYSFAFANRDRDNLSAGFSIYHYEAITIGLQMVLDHLDITDPATVTKLKCKLRSVKLDAEFIRITTGGGRNSPGPLRDRIRFVERRLADAFS